MPRGGLGDMAYSEGRRTLTIYLDREASAALDALVVDVDRSPEAVASALLRVALCGPPDLDP